jgi:hypothetical protein
MLSLATHALYCDDPMPNEEVDPGQNATIPEFAAKNGGLYLPDVQEFEPSHLTGVARYRYHLRRQLELVAVVYARIYPCLSMSCDISTSHLTRPSTTMATKALESKDTYTIGWIAALDIEHAAAVAMLDEEHSKPSRFHQAAQRP